VSWQDSLRQAQFRGIRFEVQQHAAELGRKGQLHEYPLRDQPYFEDLGRTPRKHQVQAFLVGPDYQIQRDRLRDALDQLGPGTLVHPWLGNLTVVVLSARLIESTSKGGYCEFNIEFVESDAPLQPDERADTQDELVSRTSSLRQTTSAALVQSWPLADQPAWVAQQTAVPLHNWLDSLVSAFQQSTELLQLIAQLRTDLPVLLANPAHLAEQLTPICAEVGRSNTSIQDWIELADQFDLVLSPEPQRSSAGHQAVAEARWSLFTLISIQWLSLTAEAMAELTFATSTEAAEVQARLLDRIDVLVPSVADEVFEALQDYQVALQADINQRSLQLPRLRTLTVERPQPLLRLAQNEYQDGSQAEQMLQRNPLRHPGFVPAATVLELIDA
jgi:hypothetical protein